MKTSELLGEENLASELFDCISKSSKHIFLLTGPTASGKTTIGRILAKLWGSVGSALIATGDATNQDREFYPLYWSLQRAAAKDIDKTFVTDFAKALSKSIPLFGESVSSILDYIGTRGKKIYKSKTKFLSDVEQDILYFLERTANKSDLLLICDNFHWWDNKSINLIHFILTTPTLCNVYKFISNIKILLISTRECANIKEQKNIKARIGKTWKTQYIQSRDYSRLLKSLGAKRDIPQNILNDIYKICSGNIDLAKRIAILINSRGDSAEKIDKSFLCELFKIKISDANVESAIYDIMQFASVIGDNFTDKELQCITNGKKESLQAYLNRAISERFIARENEHWVFMHETVRLYFSNYDKEKNKEAHYAYAKCLDILRPHDYMMRVYHYIKSGNLKEACVLFICEQLKSVRNGHQPELKFPSECENYSRFQEYEVLLANLISCLQNYNSSKTNLAIKELHKIDDCLPLQIETEKRYLLALCYHNSLNSNMRKEALEIVEELYRNHNLKSESEQFFRVATLYILLLYDDGNTSAAKKIESELLETIAKRIDFDPTVPIQISNINAKSGLLYSPEIAEIKIQKALDYFKGDKSSAIRYPVRLFIALTNMASTQITLGKYSAGRKYSLFGMALTKKYWNIKFPQVEICISNYILSSFLSKILSPPDCVNLSMELLNSSKDFHDNMLIKNNLAVYCIHANKFKHAKVIIGKIANTISKDNYLDSYYRYFVLSNYAGLLWASGDIEAAKHIWFDIENLIESAGIQFYPYLQKRHELQSKIFSNNDCDVFSWDNFIKNNFSEQIGSSWDFYGRGFLLSDTQIWSNG